MARLSAALGAPNRDALDACIADLATVAPGALAVVLAIDGRAWAKPGTLVHLARDGKRSGWISAGCLEGELQRELQTTIESAQARLFEIDNRDLSDVFGGHGAGCRGRQILWLLPLAAMTGLRAVLHAYRHGDAALTLHCAASGDLHLGCGDQIVQAQLPVAARPNDVAADACWQIAWQPLQRVLVLGASPESAVLLPLLTQLGWRIDLHEPRPAWATTHALAERVLAELPGVDDATPYRAALVMAHHFERDRAALAHLAARSALPRYVGLLGARTRADDLFATLPAAVKSRLAPALETPAGMPLGGHGAAAIALSLAARLQSLANTASH